MTRRWEDVRAGLNLDEEKVARAREKMTTDQKRAAARDRWLLQRARDEGRRHLIMEKMETEQSSDLVSKIVWGLIGAIVGGIAVTVWEYAMIERSWARR